MVEVYRLAASSRGVAERQPKDAINKHSPPYVYRRATHAFFLG